jgi:acetolactate synthase I/II/III large subunit
VAIQDDQVNGAQALLSTLTAHQVDTCFMNPGTSEMHFVAALDSVPAMRGVLALFEGVATGAADGYARMAGRPAAVLLHLGPGLGNGLANLHNARKARSPVVAIVGDHATYHKEFDTPLESDIETVARNVSAHIRRSTKAEEVGTDAADTVAAAYGPPGQVATLILPSDVSWSEGAVATRPSGGSPAERRGSGGPVPPDGPAISLVAEALRRGEPAAFLVGGRACRAHQLAAVAAICAASGARLFCETFPARLERGAGRVEPERLAYLGEAAAAQLQGLRHLVLVDARVPVSFFAYPGKPSYLPPEDCRVHALVRPGEDVEAALGELAGAVGVGGFGGAGGYVARAAIAGAEVPGGPLTPAAACAAVGALLPEGAIVCDESNTSGTSLLAATAGAPPHDWLTLTGGSIGIALPLAVGAAIACPDRRVVALESDGSAMYTGQALWTMAREGLDVTTVVFANRSYAILNMELHRVGAEAEGPAARSMLDLSHPDLDFVALAQGMGVPATRATTAEEMVSQLGRALHTSGPTLIEAVLPTRS